MVLETLICVVVGGFYTFAGVVTARAAMLEAVMDAAIAAIAAQKRKPVDMERTAWLAGFARLVGTGALMQRRAGMG